MSEKIILKSGIVGNIKWFYRIVNGLLIYYLIYNSYFGWNQAAESEMKELCDIITKTVIGFLFGFFINIVLKYIKFKMTKEVCLHQKRYNDLNE